MLGWARIAAIIGLSSPILAVAPAPAQTNPCDAPEHRQFDFWAGKWDVTSGGGKAGTNEITVILKGCALHEHWAGARGLKGESFNYYDDRDQHWHQVWVDDHGTVQQLVGGIEDGKMVLIGEAKDARGNPRRSRITWTRLPDGSVRQLWDTSSDGGKSWSVAFDGLYRKAAM